MMKLRKINIYRAVGTFFMVGGLSKNSVAMAGRLSKIEKKTLTKTP